VARAVPGSFGRDGLIVGIRNAGHVECLALWGQATKCMWWMPWRSQAMKDVAACAKLRGAGKRAMIRRCPNGETRPARVTAT
jgi:hypothetical protein